MDNETRINSIRAILPEFKLAAGLRGEPDAEVIGDLLCNLAHYCEAEDISLGLALYRASGNYADEASKGAQFEGISIDCDRIVTGAEPKGAKRIWTISCDMEDGERPVVDIVHCDRKPTWAEITKIHPHLDGYHPDEDRVAIEEYTDIPTIS